MNFPLEIIRGIKKSVGKDYPLLFRFSAEEFVEEGRTLEESKQVAQMLEEEGVHVLARQRRNLRFHAQDDRTHVL